MPDPSVMMQDRYLAIYTGTPPSGGGAGTWEEPYDASDATKFDAIMNNPNKVPEGQSVRLLPGEFKTTGHPGDDSTSPPVGWAIRKNVRIIGSGMGVTTLKLVGMTANDKTRYAVGMDFGASGDGIDGFEMSDLTIDCNLADSENGTDVTAGAVRVRGRHIFLRRIKVVGFGTKKANHSMSVITAAGENSENCVIDDCVVDSPSSSHAASGTARFFVFEGTSNGHRFCVVRNCAARGAAVFEQPPAITEQFIAIAPGLGLGTIIEGNQIANVRYGVYGLQQAAKDLVVWNNYFRNVQKGVTWNQQNAAAAGRIVISDNMVDLSRVLSHPIGFEIVGDIDNQYADLILRKNLVRQIPDTAHNRREDAGGLEISRCTHLIAENNLIDDILPGDDYEPIRVSHYDSAKFFNNQTTAGVLLRGYDVGAGRFVLELEDEVQDVLLAI